MSQEFVCDVIQPSDEDFHTFFNVCENILSDELNSSESKPVERDGMDDNFNAFFNHCEKIIQDELEALPTVTEASQLGCSLNPRVQQRGATEDDDVETPLRFNIAADESCHVKRFKMVGRRVTFHMADPPADVNPVTWFKEGMEEMLTYILKTVPASDHIGLVMYTPQCELGPAWISFRRADQMHIHRCSVGRDIYNTTE